MPRWRPLALAVASVGLVMAGPASSAAGAQAGAASTRAGLEPSTAAEMICQPEAQADIGVILGVQPTQVTTPTWVNHVYSCRYVYTNGVIVLSVREFPDASSTERYLDELAKRLGKRTKPFLAQGGFFTANGSVIVRKDANLLDIDVSQVPAKFGDPSLALGPPQVAEGVAVVILKCWRQR